MKFIVRRLTPYLWPAFEDLFGRNGACNGCWCMFWRLGAAYRKAPRAENKAAFHEIVKRGPPPGLIAFDGDVAVGWAAASDHAIDRGLPSASILSLIAKHRIGVALEALAHHHAAPGMLRSLLGAVLPVGRSSQQQRRECKRGTDTLPDGHCASLQAFWSNHILLFQSVQRRIRTADRLLES